MSDDNFAGWLAIITQVASDLWHRAGQPRLDSDEWHDLYNRLEDFFDPKRGDA